MRLRLLPLPFLAAIALAVPAHSERPLVRSNLGREYLRRFGTAAEATLAPQSRNIGALVALPKDRKAEELGLLPVTPGIGKIMGSAARIDAWSSAHPDLRLEIAPPLRMLNDRANQWVTAPAARLGGMDGAGVMVGVIDSGLDVSHPEMRDENGNSRVAWMLDYSIQPLGIHPELEQQFGSKDDTGKVTLGAVFSRADIDARLAAFAANEESCDESKGNRCLPVDELGHGTHVTGTAAGSGVNSRYGGIAPKADLVIVRGIRAGGGGIDNDFLTSGIQFMFERADAAKQPMVVNISLGSDFGPHDGTTLWEQSLATYVGPTRPGHAIVAAAGNTGSIAETPIHQNVRVTPGATMRVPVNTNGAKSGTVEVWLTLHPGADLKIGLDGPDGEWVPPIGEGTEGGKNTKEYNAGVIYGSNLENSPIPSGSRGAVVVWQGTKWPDGTYNVTLEGSGVADMWVAGFGGADSSGSTPALFAHGVREGTINLPATHPSIIGVGCTVDRVRWTSIGGADIALRVGNLDVENGLPLTRAITEQPSPLPAFRELREGEVCWFSSTGPTATGVQKPEIAAPGALVVSAMSRSAVPGTPGSVFTNPSCPLTKTGATDNRCFQVDEHHAIASGTSMSTPVVAGVVALLLQADPTLTQDKIMGLLQAGAHRFRTSTIDDDDGGPGEADAMGSLDALAQMKNPATYMPSAATSWITLGTDYVPADGSSAVTAIVELRTADGAHRGDLFDAGRLRPYVLLDGVEVAPPTITRRAPGVWFYQYSAPAGSGGKRATFGATFDGASIVAPKTLPVAPDRWTAKYPSHATGSSCSTGLGAADGSAAILALGALLRRRRRARLAGPFADDRRRQ